MRGDTVEMAMLLDCYGGLLTPKQREYFELYYSDDLSLSEIAENVGITPPGVRDIISRAATKLREAERKTGLAAKNQTARDGLVRAITLAEVLRGTYPRDSAIDELIQLLNEVSNGL
ncbi:MAG: DNA-binding protein [Oscillospiraceae bacterium]|nr:DNA-binding protein [Oscillospiraceae bacterium]